MPTAKKSNVVEDDINVQYHRFLIFKKFLISDFSGLMQLIAYHLEFYVQTEHLLGTFYHTHFL